MADKIQHKLGERVEVDSVPRLKGKKFEVILGTSCTQCDFRGLGHVLCHKINCSQHERSDHRSVAYREVESE